MDKKIKGVKIKRLFCHIHLTWKLTRERKEIILLKGQENRGFKIPVKQMVIAFGRQKKDI